MMVAKYRGAKHLNPSTPSLDQKIKTMLEEELNRDGFYVLKRHMNLKVQVAQISYGYRNGNVIKMLKQRGTLIGNGKNTKKLEKEIMDRVVQD